VAEFYWQVTRIELLSPPSYIALRRNEISNTVAADSTVKGWMRDSEKFSPLVADGCRQQRQTMALREPKFRIHAHIVARSGFEKSLIGFDRQFERRATKGKFFAMPCMGCREFPAFFEYVEDVESAREKEPAADVNQDLGHMLYDVFDLGKANDEFAKPYVSVFMAEIKDGVLEVPEYSDSKVKKPEVPHAS
jgi:CRISPR-associated protein Cas5d